MLALDKVQTNTISKDESIVLAKAITRLFKHWGISQEAQCSLLGISLSSRKKLKSMEEGSAEFQPDVIHMSVSAIC